MKKAFDAMDWERCLLLLEGHGNESNGTRALEDGKLLDWSR